MSISSPARSLNLRLLASLLLRPKLAALLPPPTHLPAARTPYSTTAPLSRDTSPPPPAPTSSVSATEVSHFSRLAASWWDPHGPSRLLHLMNPLRHDFINSCLHQSLSDPTSPRSPKGDTKKHSYLDIGCGGGIFSSSAARLASTASVTAIDPTPSVIAIAKAHQRSDPSLSEPNLRYLNCAIEDLPLPPSPSSTTITEEDVVQVPQAAADIITLFEVLEHIDSPSHFLHTTVRHLQPGGWLIGSTIARSPLSFLTTKVIAEAPLIGVVPPGTHDWNKYINPSELAEWFEKDGRAGRWAPMKTQGVIYLPGLGWKMVDGSEGYGNYFFGVQKLV